MNKTNTNNEVRISNVKLKRDGILHIEISDNKTFAVQLYVNRKGYIGINNTTFNYLGWDVIKFVKRNAPYANHLEAAQQKIEPIREALNKHYEMLGILRAFYNAGKEDAKGELSNFEDRFAEYFRKENSILK